MLAKMPTMAERFSFASAGDFIYELSQKLYKWQEKPPENMTFVVFLKTPDGRRMQVATLEAFGYNGFVADGYIDDLHCMTIGHISQLQLFCTFEDARSRAHEVGFVIKATPPQPAPEAPKQT